MTTETEIEHQIMLQRENNEDRIDHDHNTGKVRGLLCISCNTGVGLFKDSPVILTGAVRYLEDGKHS